VQNDFCNTISVEADANTFLVVAQKAYEDAAQIIGLIEILEASNTGNVNPDLNAGGAATAALQVHYSLIWRLQLIVARAYLRPVKKGDLHLRRGFELLKDAQVRQKAVTPERTKHLTDAQIRWDRACGDHRLSKITSTRHKFIAHIGEPDKDVEIPTYKELFDFARETALLMEQLALAAGVNMSGGGIPNETRLFAEAAKKFWSPWANGHSGNAKA
jgi:hypothetical protein